MSRTWKHGAEKLRAAARSWVACLARVFEVEPLICPKCSREFVPVADILADRELERLLAYLELPIELPRTAPARSPPFDFGGEEPESQVNPLADLNDGIDDRAFAAEDLLPA